MYEITIILTEQHDASEDVQAIASVCGWSLAQQEEGLYVYLSTGKPTGPPLVVLFDMREVNYISIDKG